MPEFAWPWVFLILPLPWILWRWLPEAAVGEALRLPFRGLRLGFAAGVARPRIFVTLLGLAWLCLVVAGARPQWLGPPQPVRQSDRTMMLAVDLSGSMRTPDMTLGGQAVSRFAAVEAIAGDFISRRVGSRMGLILFGSNAYLVTPLTYDLSAVRAQLQGAAVGLAGSQTAIGDAVGIAVKRLRHLPKKERVLVLLTDGVNNAGTLTPKQATRIAKAAGVRIYTIGIGADRMQVRGFFGTQTVNPSAGLNVNMLSNMATQTGGRFFRAASSQQLIDAYRTIGALEPVVSRGRPLRPRHELFRWPLLATLVLVLLAGCWRELAARRREVTA